MAGTTRSDVMLSVLRVKRRSLLQSDRELASESDSSSSSGSSSAKSSGAARVVTKLFGFSRRVLVAVSALKFQIKGGHILCEHTAPTRA